MRVLNSYAQFIGQVRECQASGLPVEQAVELALDNCIAQGVLTDVLSVHRAEVITMFLADYDEEYRLKLMEKEWREDAMREGLEQGALLCLIAQIRKKLSRGIADADIAEMLEVDPGQVEEICCQIQEHPEYGDRDICEALRNSQEEKAE